MSVDAEQDYPGNTAVDQKTGERCTEGNGFGDIKFGQDDAGGAVGNQADEAREDRCKDPGISNETADSIEADPFNDSIENEGDTKDDQEDVKGMVNRALQGAAVFAIAVIFVAEIMDVIRVHVGVKKLVDDESGENPDYGFYNEDLYDFERSDLMAEQDRKHLIAGRQIHGS